EDGGWRSHGRRRRHPRRGGHAGRADRRVRHRHPPGPGGRRHAVLHGPGQLGEPEPGGDPDVSRRRAPDQVRDQALNTRPRIGAGSGHPRIPWPLGDRLATHADPANFLTQDTLPLWGRAGWGPLFPSPFGGGQGGGLGYAVAGASASDSGAPLWPIERLIAAMISTTRRPSSASLSTGVRSCTALRKCWHWVF